MILLQRPDPGRGAADGADGVDGGAGGAESREVRDVALERAPANRERVADLLHAGGGVDDEIDGAGEDLVDAVGTALHHLEGDLDGEAGGGEVCRGAAGRDDAETELDESARDRHQRRLVAVL